MRPDYGFDAPRVPLVMGTGGLLLVGLTDIQHAAVYATRLRELGMGEVSLRSLGPRFWYGGPWVAASLVTATKPQST